MASKEQDDAQSSKSLPDSVVVNVNVADEHHGIPTAVFFDDIPAAVSKHTAPALIEKLSALSQKCRFFEERLVKGKEALEEKIEEVKRAIVAVSALADRSSRAGSNSKPIQTHFELSDGIYVRASIPQSTTVCLWLGANVMVEYTHVEAIKLLKKNLASAEANFKDTSNDIDFLRNQLNTADVNLSRVYNHHVQTVRASSSSPSEAKSKAVQAN